LNALNQGAVSRFNKQDFPLPLGRSVRYPGILKPDPVFSKNPNQVLSETQW
jgi:hypothetical protein